MDTHTYPVNGLPLSQLIFTLNEELRRVAYSPGYVAEDDSGVEERRSHSSPQLHLGRCFSTRLGPFHCTRYCPRVEELLRSRQPHPVGHPFPHPHPPLFPGRSFPRKCCMPSLAQDLHSTMYA